MLISDLIVQDSVVCRETANSKKRALEKISRYLAMGHAGLDQNLVFDKLMERERLGSTGLGEGVAIPHCRMQEVTQATVSLMTLESNVDFEAVDGKPVDIIFALLVPENCTETHLQILAAAAEMFNNSGFCELLRKSETSEELYTLIVNWSPSSLSA